MKLTAAFRKSTNAIYYGAFVTEIFRLDLRVELTRWKREMQETTEICYAVWQVTSQTLVTFTAGQQIRRFV